MSSNAPGVISTSSELRGSCNTSQILFENAALETPLNDFVISLSCSSSPTSPGNVLTARGLATVDEGSAAVDEDKALVVTISL
jgi:hypothetical protein